MPAAAEGTRDGRLHSAAEGAGDGRLRSAAEGAGDGDCTVRLKEHELKSISICKSEQYGKYAKTKINCKYLD